MQCIVEPPLSRLNLKMFVLITYLALFIASANSQNSTFNCTKDYDNITFEERPCIPRMYDNAESIVCVCNETYCDRYPPTRPTSKYDCIQTTSSKAGERYNKTSCTVTDGKLSTLQMLAEGANGKIVGKVNTRIRCLYPIKGFGTSMTDSSAILISSLSNAVSNFLLTSLFGPYGIRLNFVRVPIGGTDFSNRPYTLNEDYPGDVNMTHFSLAEEDLLHKLPHLKTIIEIMNSTDGSGDCCNTLRVILACWTPCIWMKTENVTSGRSKLQEKYYCAHALYVIKFIQAYEAILGHKLYAVSPMNEPSNGLSGLGGDIPCCGMNGTAQDEFLKNCLCKLLKQYVNHMKVLGHDDQTPYATIVLPEYSNATLECMYGVATHAYIDFIIPLVTDLALKYIYTNYGLIFSTEWSKGSTLFEQRGTVLGSWDRAESYIKSIIMYLRNCAVVWMEWNMCLNPAGGPTYINNTVDSTIIVNTTANEFVKNPMFYALGHFSMFVPPCSVRIEMELVAIVTYPGIILLALNNIEHIAFLTPKGIIVVVILNKGLASVKIVIVVDETTTVRIDVTKKSITTVQIKAPTSS